MKNTTLVVKSLLLALPLVSCSSIHHKNSANPHELASSNGSETNVCQERTVKIDGKSCEYVFCALSVSGYSNQVAVVLPDETQPQTEVRVHLHGYSHFKNGLPYHPDFYVSLNNGYPTESIEKTVTAFGMERTACQANPQILVMPISFGQGEDYRKDLKSFSDIEKLVANVGEELSIELKGRNLHLSGHSGGGQKLVDLISEEGHVSNVKSLALYEGIYRSNSLDSLKEWIQKNPGVEVTSYTLSMGEAYRNTRLLFGRLSDNPKDLSASELVLGRKPASVNESAEPGTLVQHVKVPYKEKDKSKEKADHYNIVKMFWVGP